MAFSGRIGADDTITDVDAPAHQDGVGGLIDVIWLA
jgi:hypothetical protein